MSMSAPTLRDLIDTKFAAISPTDYGAWSERATFKANLLQAVAEAVVEHIQTAALVTVTVTSVSGVTAGGGTSGPGSGTGTIL